MGRVELYYYYCYYYYCNKYINRANQKDQENEDCIDRLQEEVERLSKSNERYKQAKEMNINKIRELQKQLTDLNLLSFCFKFVDLNE